MEWINVKDRLPSKENQHIVCLINEKPLLCCVHDATVCLTKDQVSFYWPTKKWMKDVYYGEVTHWMPLPEPPEDK